jgi:hypothetical protein
VTTMLRTFFSGISRFALRPRRIRHFNNIVLGGVARSAGISYKLVEPKAVKGSQLDIIYGAPDLSVKFQSIIQTPKVLFELANSSEEIVKDGQSTVQLVNAPSGHYDRVDVELVQLSTAAQQFVRDPKNEMILHLAFLNVAFPLPQSDPNRTFQGRWSDGSEDVTVDWSISTKVPGLFSLGVSTVDVTRPFLHVNEDGLVVFGRLATTELEHNLGGDRLQLTYLTPDGKLGSVVPGMGRHPLPLVDHFNPFVGVSTFVPAHLRMAATIEVLATKNSGEAWDITSPEFRQAVNKRAYADNKKLWWLERALSVADGLGLGAQYVQILFGQTKAEPLTLPDASTPESGEFAETVEKLDQQELVSAPVITKEEAQEVLRQELPADSDKK